MNHYETVFILNPVLSDTQIKETVQKFEDYLVSKGAEMISKEKWFLPLIRVQNCWSRNSCI
jgi:small subunit ribosomal protein S6